MSETLLMQLAQTNADHITTLNGEMGLILQRMAVVETKVNAIEEGIRYVILMLIGLVIKSLWDMLIHVRNGRKNAKK